jgi:hypothetical protein
MIAKVTYYKIHLFHRRATTVCANFDVMIPSQPITCVVVDTIVGINIYMNREADSFDRLLCAYLLNTSMVSKNQNRKKRSNPSLLLQDLLVPEQFYVETHTQCHDDIGRKKEIVINSCDSSTTPLVQNWNCI